MTDAETPIAALKAMQARFVAERDWKPFHTPKNLAMAVAIEAAELMELFLWVRDEGDGPTRNPAPRAEIEAEVADVALCLFNLCNALDVDLASAVEAKVALNAAKYPAEQVRGRAEKYDFYRRGGGGDRQKG